ncbi:MAG: PDZ domain-containing protein [Planctomycetaceae bacterium]
MPAEAAGLQRRDRITAVDGSPIANASDLREVISHKHPKDAVELTILRDDQEQTLSVTLGEMTADVPDELPSDPTTASDTQPGEETRVGRWVDTLGKDEAFVLGVCSRVLRSWKASLRAGRPGCIDG